MPNRLASAASSASRCVLLLAGLGGEQHQVRRPPGVLGGAGTAGEHGVLARRCAARRRRCRVSASMVSTTSHVVEVAQPVGRERR